MKRNRFEVKLAKIEGLTGVQTWSKIWSEIVIHLVI